MLKSSRIPWKSPRWTITFLNSTGLFHTTWWNFSAAPSSVVMSIFHITTIRIFLRTINTLNDRTVLSCWVPDYWKKRERNASLSDLIRCIHTCSDTCFNSVIADKIFITNGCVYLCLVKQSESLPWPDLLDMTSTQIIRRHAIHELEICTKSSHFVAKCPNVADEMVLRFNFLRTLPMSYVSRLFWAKNRYERMHWSWDTDM